MQGLKNLIGNLLGYGRCPVTRDTYWKADLASVPYSDTSGVMVSARALNEVPKERIAEIVLKKSKSFVVIGRRYTLEQITNEIPNGCQRFPREV